MDRWRIILTRAVPFGLFLLGFMAINAWPSEKAVFAGGCFWCMQPPFDQSQGVISTRVGYTGGKKEFPSYEEVSSGVTGHTEAIEITFDPKKVTYQKLLNIFWRNIDPLTKNAQFCDHGDQYRSGIFFYNDTQKTAALESKRNLDRLTHFKSKIVTEIVPATVFYPAEEYHQNYYKKNPIRYKFYRSNCGRDKRLKELWGTLSSVH